MLDEGVSAPVPRPAPPSVLFLAVAGLFAGFIGGGLGCAVVIAVAHALGVFR